MYLKSYKELIVWQKSIELVKEIYKITNTFPKNEVYGLCSQMQRAAVSIPSNIAEGYSRKNTNSGDSEKLLEEVLKMLNTIIGKLKITNSLNTNH